MSIKIQEIKEIYRLENDSVYIVQVERKLTAEQRKQIIDSLKELTNGMNVRWGLMDGGLELYKSE